MQAPPQGGFAAPRFRVAALVLLAVYFAFLTWQALRPLPAVWVPPTNLEPLATVRSHLAAGPADAVRGIGGGLLLFAPLGVLLPLVAGHVDGPCLLSLVRTTFGGTLLSAGVELLETGVPGHVSDVDAVLLGTAGTALTRLLLYPPLSRWVGRRSAAAVRGAGTDGGGDAAGGGGPGAGVAGGRATASETAHGGRRAARRPAPSARRPRGHEPEATGIAS